MRCFYVIFYTLYYFVSTDVIVCAGFVQNLNSFGPSRSPCPSVFQYQYDGNEWYGIVTTPSVPYGTAARLMTRFTIAQTLPTKYSGNLEVLGSRNDIFNSLVNELPIQYRVYFPISFPLPAVKIFTLNDIIICQGPIVTGPIVTTITLEHSLYPHGWNLNAQFPQQQPPQQQQQQPQYPTQNQNVEPKLEIIPEITWTAFTTTIKPKPKMNFNTKSFPENNYDECGSSLIARPLVANGDPVEKGAYPWLTALFVQKDLGWEFRCSGNLITTQHILTAGHCTYHLRPEEILVFLGKHRLKKWNEDGSVAREAHEIIIHPDYKSITGDADLSIIIITDPINFTFNIRPVCIWHKRSDISELVGQSCTVVGWGRDETGARITREPKQAKVRIVSQEQCLRSKVDYKFITSNRTMCAAGERQNSGPCTGDSGGGLLVQLDDGKWYLRGIVSMALPNPETKSCDFNNYSVFVDMAKFVDWVERFL